jgi:ABC-type transporter Mla MlaB component
VQAVLRITQIAPPEVTLKIEGRVTGEAVDVLEQECHSQIDDGNCVRLDFADVDSVDQQAVSMLRRLADRCVRIEHAPPFVAALLGEGPLQ